MLPIVERRRTAFNVRRSNGIALLTRISIRYQLPTRIGHRSGPKRVLYWAQEVGVTETLISPEHPAVHVTPAPQRPRDVAPGATILVCDDQVDIVEMLVSVLEMEGFTPLMAYCG